MIIVDDKTLNLTVDEFLKDGEKNPEWEKLSLNEQWAINKLIEIYKIKKLRIVNPKKMDKYQLATKPTKGFDISGRRPHPTTGVMQHWRYSDQPPIGKDKKYFPTAHRAYFREATFVGKDQPELILFLMYIVNLPKQGFVIENKQEESKKVIAERRLSYSVGNWINNKLSGVEINKYAYRWGIRDIQEKSEEEVRNELFNLVARLDGEKRDEKRGFQAFLDEINSDSDVVKIGAAFYKGIEDNQIAFDKSSRRCFWSNTSEPIGNVIPPQRFAIDKEEYIIQYLVNNPKDKELFLSTMKDEVKDVGQLTEDYTLIKIPAQLRGWALKNHDLKIPIESIPLMQARIKEHLDKMSAPVE